MLDDAALEERPADAKRFTDFKPETNLVQPAFPGWTTPAASYWQNWHFQKSWYAHGESNPGLRRERAPS
jgi:hypothetical protein